MQKTLKPIDFMNEMHEYEFKSFQKHLFSTQNFQKQDYNTFCPKFSIKHILQQIHRTYNFGWPNQIHT